jgi:uncharacterized protein
MLRPAMRAATGVRLVSKPPRRTVFKAAAAALAPLSWGALGSALTGCATDPVKPGSFGDAWTSPYQPPAFQALLDEGRELTVLGGLHSGLPGFYPLPGALQGIWRRADALLIEIDAQARHAALVEAFRPVVRLPEGITLEQLIADRWIVEARALFGWSDARWAELRIMQPWWVANFAFTAALPDQRWSPTAQQGLERVMLGEARKRTIPVLELEPPIAQVQALSSRPLAEQGDQFVAWLRDIQRYGAMWPQLLQAWRAGDTRALAQLKARWWGHPEDPVLAALHESAFVDRDQAMARSLIEQMQLVPVRRPFALVGAFHLVGPKSLVEQLAALGLQLRPLNYNSGL